MCVDDVVDQGCLLVEVCGGAGDVCGGLKTRVLVELCEGLAVKARLAVGDATAADALLRRAREIAGFCVAFAEQRGDEELRGRAEAAMLKAMGIHCSVLADCGWEGGREAVLRLVRILEGKLGLSVEVR